MSQALIPTSTSAAEWTPPQAKMVRRIVTGAIIFLLASVGALAFTKIAPTWIAATELLTKWTGDMTHLAIAGGVLAFVIWLLIQTFSPSGGINKLFNQAYSSFINRMTWSLLDIDPITPLEDVKRETLHQKASFDEAFARFDGMISNLQQTEQQFTTEADDAERQAKAAKAKVDAGQTRFANTFQSLAYQAGELRKSAARFSLMRQNLEPVRATIVQLQDAAEVMIANLDTDIRIKRKEWQAQNDMKAIDTAARGILKGTPKQALAQNAAQLIEMKYADQMGRLRNLAATSQNLIDSVDLNKATYSEELLTKWQQESAPILIEGPKAPALQDQSNAFAKLVR